MCYLVMQMSWPLRDQLQVPKKEKPKLWGEEEQAVFYMPVFLFYSDIKLFFTVFDHLG